jgi:hypothetical protein
VLHHCSFNYIQFQYHIFVMDCAIPTAPIMDQSTQTGANQTGVLYTKIFILFFYVATARLKKSWSNNSLSTSGQQWGSALEDLEGVHIKVTDSLAAPLTNSSPVTVTPLSKPSVRRSHLQKYNDYPQETTLASLSIAANLRRPPLLLSL